MRSKLLLVLLLFCSGILSAQTDTIKTLIISEARMDRGDMCYVELTNMGTETVNLSDFEFGSIRPWADPWTPETNFTLGRLGDVDLPAGETYTMAIFNDYREEQYAIEVAKFGYSPNWSAFVTKPEMWQLADLQIHAPEANVADETDSVTTLHWAFTDIWNGRECWYVRHHFPNVLDPLLPDSAVIDQVGGVFDVDGRNSTAGMYDVAGVEGATGNSILVRKFSVKEGNIVFVQGTDLAESEWIPLPRLRGGYEPEAAVFWTVGNHGNYVLSDLVSATANIDYVDSTITVPWGVRNRDSLVTEFDRIGGIAWHYEFHTGVDSLLTEEERAQMHEDSAYSSVRTGDIFSLYACGNTLEQIDLKVVVEPPTVSDNIVIPKYAHNDNGDYEGAGIPWDVSDGIAGMDTISEIPFGTRSDSLLKYLEKAPAASWEFVWVDDIKTPELKDGDMLRVTAEDGTSVKDYYIKVQKYRKARDAELVAITWPDIPVYLYDLFDWMGDTIPNFVPGAFNYKILLPFDVVGIPALVGTPEDQNATVAVDRAVHLGGSVAHRTTTFTVTAEDDTTTIDYVVLMEKEADPSVDVQPWTGAEPFISENVFWEQWSNGYVELVNPGNLPMDLSNYMFYGGGADNPANAITEDAEATGSDWLDRFRKYIPGYKWAADSATWKADPAMAVQDLSVTKTLQAGDVFVMGGIHATGQSYSTYNRDPDAVDGWPTEQNIDVLFNHGGQNEDGTDKLNQWDEAVGGYGCRNWTGANYYLFKILNDSIQRGLKPATDPNDFMLLDMFGGNDEAWVIGGKTINMITSSVRKPHIYEGNLVPNGSFAGPTPEDDSCEWILTDRPFYSNLNKPWPLDILLVSDNNIGKHFMHDVTIFKSTVASIYYKVSEGYTMDESIMGVTTGTTADGFIANILKVDEGQTLTVKGASELAGTDVVSDGDTLVVLSADGDNTTKYVLEVTADGLSSDALLTSTVYTIDAVAGTITGLDFETTIEDMLTDIVVPAGATLTVIDGDDRFVPLQKLNFDSLYVMVTASANIYFEVVAENFTTTITYQLMPDVMSSDAFVTSQLFTVDDVFSVIELIPGGTAVPALLANLTPATGATMKVLDKLGGERTVGNVYQDDILVVTAEDGTTINVYYFSMLKRDDDLTALYLAYVLSDDYTVDQVALSIAGNIVASATQVGTFMSSLTAAPDATFMVTNSAGVEKADTENLAEGDMLVVTAGDGVTMVSYMIMIDATAVEEFGSVALNAYPNPSSGAFTVEGLEAGQRVRIFNSLGANVLDLPVQQRREEISLEGQPDGIYFISVSKENRVIGTLRVIKR